ncbi:MAG: hypothetical protein V3R71_06470 [Gemmatimonadales bacterium]
MIEAILAAFAGWRVASLMVNEAGPWDGFERLRIRVGIPPQGEAGEISSNPLAGALSCIWCCSVWTAGGAYLVAEFVVLWPVALVAAMGMAIVIHEYGDN